MIPVQPQEAPDEFEDSVADPGAKFLRLHPSPTQNEWNNHAYWRKAIPDLLRLYNRMCAYTAFRIPHVTGAATVEHFVPKTVEPPQAYDWNNFRLVCGSRNTKRGRKKILDPFKIREGTFAIVFPSLEVTHGPLGDNDPDLVKIVKLTCIALDLNDESDCIAKRLEYLHKYYDGRISFIELQSEAPFLASELERHGLEDKQRLGEMMSFDNPFPKQNESVA